MNGNLKVLHIGQSRIFDVRHRYPGNNNSPVSRWRTLADLTGAAVHHDAVIMPPGDLDYSGSTLDEDLERLDIIYRVAIERGWGGFPYHAVASPNSRTFYTTDVRRFGAHVARRNHELVGIALMGNFTEREPLPAQLCAAGLGLVALYRLTARLLDTRGHREWALAGEGTQCPGDSWWRWQRDLLAITAYQGRIAFPRS